MSHLFANRAAIGTGNAVAEREGNNARSLPAVGVLQKYADDDASDTAAPDMDQSGTVAEEAPDEMPALPEGDTDQAGSLPEDAPEDLAMEEAPAEEADVPEAVIDEESADPAAGQISEEDMATEPGKGDIEVPEGDIEPLQTKMPDVKRGAPFQLVSTKGTRFSEAEKKKVFKANRSGGMYTCESCNFSHALKTYFKKKGGRIGDGGFQVDHIKHFSKGGKGVASNGRILCGTCNTSRGAKKAAKTKGRHKYAFLHNGSKATVIGPSQYAARKRVYMKAKRKNKKAQF